MPISDELHDLVGNPVPPGDLGQRARARATEIKRRRLAGLATSVVAVTVLAVPGALLVRDQSGNVNGAVGSGSESPNPAATSATADVKRVVVPAPTEVRAGTLTSRDRTRAATALSLLGKGFTQTGSGQVVAVKTGKLVGASATFTATNGGGTVAVQWTEGVGIAYAVTAPGLAGVPALPSAAIASAAVASAAPAVASAVGTPPSGAAASALTAIVVVGGGSSLPSASADPGEPNSVTSESGGNTLTTPGTFSAGTVWTGGVGGDINGMVSVNGNLALSIKVVQGTAGSPRILSGKAALAFANALAKALR